MLKTVSALHEEDYEEVGRLMNESHTSLRQDFEVSNPFMDRLVDLAHETPGVLGARLTGGGFGGATVNLLRTDALRDFNRNVVRRYNEETSLASTVFSVRPRRRPGSRAPRLLTPNPSYTLTLLPLSERGVRRTPLRGRWSRLRPAKFPASPRATDLQEEVQGYSPAGVPGVSPGPPLRSSSPPLREGPGVGLPDLPRNP